MIKPYTIYIISDALGETAEHIAKAAAEQFCGHPYRIEKHPYLTDAGVAEKIIEQASAHSIVIFTTVLLDLRKAIVAACQRRQLRHIDVMSPLIESFEDFLGAPAKCEPGVTHKLDENYFKRVAAVEFAVKYDDGKDPRGLKKADIVIVGISRTSKTPLSMYLAHQNYKVANVPLVPDVPLPQELYDIDNQRIVGLTTNPIKLNEVRTARLKAMGLDAHSSYASMARIMEELDYAEKVMKRLGCPVIDVSDKAIEETALIVADYVKN